MNALLQNRKNDLSPPAPPGRRALGYQRGRLLPAAAVGAAVLAGLLRYGLPVWQAVCWSLAFGLILPLRLDLSERWAVWVRRGAFLLAPALAFVLVEQMNYNYQLWRELSALQILLNLVWYYMLAGLLYLAVGRLALSAGLSAGLFVCIGLANRYVIHFRGRTIFPGDLLSLRTAVNVANNYDYTPDVVQLHCLLVLALFLLLLWKLPRRSGRNLPKLKTVLPLAAAGAVYLVVFFQTGFLSWVGIEPSLWTTRGNGFLLNFSVCLRYSAVEEPEGYSPETLETVAGLPVEPPPAEKTRPVNVIVIMNESFSDLTGVFGLETNTEPMPFLRGLRENTVKGTAYASVFGGTTANSEYEFLTGNTMAFLPDGTVPFHLYVTPGAPNLGAQMKDLGYHTVFLHPYLSSGWNRRAVYRDFGFDQILFQQDIKNPAYMRNYITDQSSYENVVRLYEEKEEGSPFFMFNVTMQNHSAYSVPWDGLDRTVWLTGDLEGRFRTVDQYLSLIRQSDSAFQYLVEYFRQVEEPTMLLMFGDHQPQVATNFYTELLGGEFETLDAATAQRRQAVPFVLWANYDIPEEEGVETSINYLSTLLMETAGLPMTGYQQFLSRLRETAPALNGVGYRDPEGNWYKRMEDLPQSVQEGLKGYQMLQYNLLFDGADSRLEEFFTLPETWRQPPST